MAQGSFRLAIYKYKNESVKKGINIIMKDYKKYFKCFFCGLILGLVATASITLLFSKGANWKYLIWNGDTIGVFPDFFQSIGDGISKTPYDHSAIYPAFAYLICYGLGKLIPGFNYQNWGEMSVSKSATVISFLFFFLCICGVMYYTKKILENESILYFCSIVLFLTSAPFIYMLERGNMVILSMLFVFIFLFGYNHPNAKIRHIAYISLACASAMKIYPAILGLLVVQQRKLKNIIILLIYGILFFIVPFLIYGTPRDIIKMFSNAFALNTETIIDTRNFGYGFKINIQNFLNAIGDYYNIDLNNFSIILSVVIFILLILCSIVCREQWQKIACLSLIIVTIPTFSWIYNAIYMFPVILFFLKEKIIQKQLNMKDYIYLIQLLFVFIPLPYGELFKSLKGVNKISYSTFICSLSLYLLMFLLIGEGIKYLIIHKKQILNKLER